MELDWNAVRLDYLIYRLSKAKPVEIGEVRGGWTKTQTGWMMTHADGGITLYERGWFIIVF